MEQIVTGATSGIVGVVLGALLDSLRVGRKIERYHAHIHEEFEALRNHVDDLRDHVDTGFERVNEQISLLRERLARLEASPVD